MLNFDEYKKLFVENAVCNNLTKEQLKEVIEDVEIVLVNLSFPHDFMMRILCRSANNQSLIATYIANLRNNIAPKGVSIEDIFYNSGILEGKINTKQLAKKSKILKRTLLISICDLYIKDGDLLPHELVAFKFRKKLMEGMIGNGQ